MKTQADTHILFENVRVSYGQKVALNDVSVDDTETIFNDPADRMTAAYVTGAFG